MQSSLCTAQKAVEQEPTATMLQLDAPRGNVNTVVNDTIRSTYPVCCTPLLTLSIGVASSDVHVPHSVVPHRVAHVPSQKLQFYKC